MEWLWRAPGIQTGSTHSYDLLMFFHPIILFAFLLLLSFIYNFHLTYSYFITFSFLLKRFLREIIKLKP